MKGTAMNSVKHLLTLAAISAVSATFAGTVINVPGDQATLADALAAASGASEENPVEIRIADGDYQQTATLAVPSYVTLRGNDADPSQVKILGDNSKSTFTVMTLAANATASGVWVRKGYYKASNMPGGVKVSGGTLTNSWVSECYVSTADGGGGVLNADGLVTHCRIFQNYRAAQANGIGLRQWGANAVTEYCEICNNRCESVVSSSISGGGLYVTGGLVSHCIITNNMAGPVQGSNTYYGGVYLSTATMEYCLVADNAAMNTGGVYINHDNKSTAATVVRNCTIVGNRSRLQAGLVRDTAVQNNRKYRIENTIVWDNYATFAAADGDQDLSNIVVDKYLTVTGLCSRAGVGELAVSSDPVFVDPAKGDYRLAANSPCRGAGLDADGNPCDLGYAPYDGAATRELPTYAVQPAVFVSKTGSKTAPYDTMEKATDDIFAALNYCGDGTVLTVNDGTYEINREIELRHAIVVRSASGNPSSVTFKTKSGTVARTLKIAHGGAVASGITFSGGTLNVDRTLETGSLAAVSCGTVTNCVLEKGTTQNVQSGGANVDNRSGLIVDSVIRDTKGGGNKGCAYHQAGTNPQILGTTITACQGYHNSAQGAGGYLEAGLMDRCQVTNNLCTGSSSGAGVYGTLIVDAATVRNTVIAQNKANNKANKFSGVQLGASAVMDNCTVVSNAAQAASAVGGIAFVTSAAVAIRNTVIYGNTINNYVKPPVLSEYSNYSSSVTAENNAVTKLEPSIAFGDACQELGATDPIFQNAAKGDFTPARKSVLINNGQKLPWMTADSLDAYGLPRMSQLIPDIGACERQIIGLMLLVR